MIACWLGNRNTEKSDKIMFKNYYKKKKKQKKEIEEGKIIKKIKLSRLFALSESLLSIFLDPNEVENTTYDHTIDFY